MTPSPALSPAVNQLVEYHRLTVQSPVGALTLIEHDGTLTGLTWEARPRVHQGAPTALLAEAESQLAAYFDRRLEDFDLPLAAPGRDFQKRVWKAIRAIRYGSTRTYGALAKKLGTGPRALAGACGANPIPILIPCHRVLGAGGRLHGYSGRGGIMTKGTLLSLEGVRTRV
ncbi:MAG: methylated-DNA--[protein]-cysteine S-methyltransferase [Alphaproteobacteria bacterium]|nr:methylated-DNA--[protein]-cysteine S-methyltransferase [Alphaproteobacteria bacterium]